MAFHRPLYAIERGHLWERSGVPCVPDHRHGKLPCTIKDIV